MKALLLLVVLVAGLAVETAAQSAEDLFQQALRVERISGNTEAAIELYGQIVTDHASERAVVARALLQMGKAYEILGRDGARDAFSRVVNEYADFTSVASEAAERIAALRKLDMPAPASAWTPGSTEVIVLNPETPTGQHPMAAAAMSPDGNFVARGTPGRNRGLVLQNLESGAVDSLTAIQELCGYTFSAQFSPNGRQIAFGCYPAGRDSEGPWGVAVFDRDSREANLVFDGGAYFGECDYWFNVLDWSEDGTEILAAVQFCGEPEGQILLVPVSGGEPRVLETDFEKTLFWGTTACLLRGGRFLFGVYGSEPTSIHRLDTESGERAVVLSDELEYIWLYDCLPESNTLIYSRTQTLNPKALFAATIGPDGSLGAPRFLASIPDRSMSIPGAMNGNVYFGEQYSEMFVAVADIDAERGRAVSSIRKVDAPTDAGHPVPHWSPDGDQFIVTSRWTATIAGSNGIERTQWEAPFFDEGDGDPEYRKWLGLVLWSPDGNQLISSYPSGTSPYHYKGTEVYDQDSGAVLFQVPNLAAIAWMPDASGFYYVDHRDESRRCLSVYNFESLETREVYCLDGEPTSELPAVRWRWWFSPGWSLSPDGSTFAYWGREQSAEGTESPIYLISTATWEMERIGDVVIEGRNPGISWSGDSRLLFMHDTSERTTRVYNRDERQWEEWSLSGLADLQTHNIAFHPDGERVAMSGSGPELEGLRLLVLHRPPGLLEDK